eukprot:scaffold338_cov116-Cylindrotheca_fusiformis.AAC.3
MKRAFGLCLNGERAATSGDNAWKMFVGSTQSMNGSSNHKMKQVRSGIEEKDRIKNVRQLKRAP